MKLVKYLLGGLLGALLIASAFGHLLNPGLTSGMIPDFLPKTAVHIATAIVEAVLGIGVFLPRYRNKALLGVVIFLFALLPIHILDLLRDQPVIGSQTAAIIRIPMQFLLMGIAWFARTTEPGA